MKTKTGQWPKPKPVRSPLNLLPHHNKVELTMMTMLLVGNIPAFQLHHPIGHICLVSECWYTDVGWATYNVVHSIQFTRAWWFWRKISNTYGLLEYGSGNSYKTVRLYGDVLLYRAILPPSQLGWGKYITSVIDSSPQNPVQFGSVWFNAKFNEQL